MPPKSERLELRLDETLSNRLDQWCSEHNTMSRSEGVRELMLLGLDRSTRNAVHFSDGEKLIIAMLADYQKESQSREIDTDSVMNAIYGGHLWALKWEMQGLFHDHIDTPGAVSLVVDTLDMWSFIEEAVESFSNAERRKLEEAVGATGKNPQFFGFDGNHESDYLGIASHLINRMDRFQRFKGRGLNSHMQVVPRYARMTRLFQPMRASIGMRHPIKLTLGEVISLLKRDDG